MLGQRARAHPWRAHYVCAAAYADASRQFVAVGRTDGAFLPDAQGTGGFGYDPHFVSDDLGISFAAARREDKARVSHRARAFRALLGQLDSLMDERGAR
ncbi:MAG: non-canonical purine NTP pyrophosphatase [Gemmatimonadaceae bacterium]|nr:non-canonical purine NTP pyrophosphatase [Gemmatimonadaceae bacterium]